MGAVASCTPLVTQSIAPMGRCYGNPGIPGIRRTTNSDLFRPSLDPSTTATRPQPCVAHTIFEGFSQPPKPA